RRAAGPEEPLRHGDQRPAAAAPAPAPAAQPQPQPPQQQQPLSAREHEVMLLALKGLSSKLIARELSISPRTVEQHRRRLLEKTGVRSIAELQRRQSGSQTPT